MKNIVLLGGGGHMRSVLDALLRTGEYDDIVITDKDIPAGKTIMGVKIAGDDSILPELYSDGYEYAFITVGCVGDTSLRRKIFLNAKQFGFKFPSIIDPSAVVSEYAKVGNGVFVGKNAVVNAGAEIGDHAIINTGAIIEHDCRIGFFSHIAVGAVVCGECSIEEDVFIGANVTVPQCIRIKRNTFVRAGELVKRDIM